MFAIDATSVLDSQEIPKDNGHILCRQKINFYVAMHKKSLAREEELEHQLEVEKAKVRKLQQQLFGKKSEGSKNIKSKSDKIISSKPKGQQKDSKGHGRTARPQMPVQEEVIDVAEKNRICPCCNELFKEIFEPEESEIYEIEVSAYKRKIIRKKYKHCNCNGKGKIISAPPADRLFSKTIYGVSIWAKFLTNKFILSVPIERTCKELLPYLGPISPGTIVGGFKKITPLFDQLIDGNLY